MAPSLTEMVYALGQQDRLLGNTLQCDFPVNARSIFKIGSFARPQLELIIMLKPDVVFATEGNPKFLLQSLVPHKIRTVFYNPTNLTELADNFKDMAQILDVPDRAQMWVNKLDEVRNNSQKTNVTNDNVCHPTAVFLLQHSPMYSASGNTWLGGLSNEAGFKSITQQLPAAYPQISMEFLLSKKLDFIFILFPYDKKNKHQKIDNNFKLLKNTKIIDIDPDLFLRPGPRALQGLSILKEIRSKHCQNKVKIK